MKTKQNNGGGNNRCFKIGLNTIRKKLTIFKKGMKGSRWILDKYKKTKSVLLSPFSITKINVKNSRLKLTISRTKLMKKPVRIQSAFQQKYP